MAKGRALALFAMGVFTAVAATAQTPQSCAKLSSLSVPQTEIVQASVVEAGKLDLGPAEKSPLYGYLPAFCRVVAISRPTADSNIKIEVWLPLAGWNGKFAGTGNGGFAGSIGYLGLAGAVLSGFATGGTDAGHTGGAGDSAWALGHPEKVIDFGYRGVHVMTEFGKAVVKTFYDSAARENYFSSCSDGGREALMEAQRFPADYDGILAGAPAYNWTGLISRAADLSSKLDSSKETYIPASKLPAIRQAVLDACHKQEPGAFLADPRSCHFSPDTLLCKGPETDACLTPPQAASLKVLYAGSYLKDGKLVYPGMLPGAETGNGGWSVWVTGKFEGASADAGMSQGYFRNLVYANPTWNLRGFDLDRDLKAGVEKTGDALNAVNPDLSAFKARGGKLVLYHGWNDPAISALGTIDYYDNVSKTMGATTTASFVRLFVVPGMQHCYGGPGPADFGQFGLSANPAFNDPAHNLTLALEQWVEKGTAPEQVIARGKTDPSGAGKGDVFTQPICAWPKAAAYNGTGDTKDAASYACVSK
jgi:feruloyl esterase